MKMTDRIFLSIFWIRIFAAEEYIFVAEHTKEQPLRKKLES